MPDGVIYKACGNRRESVCPSCSKVYQRDAYQLVRAGLVGGKGVPETVATHPCLFVTLTAPGFGAVHTRPVPKHTCANRRRCDCRPLPCHPGRTTPCPHGKPTVCFARHEVDDQVLGVPLCLDCYDHNRQVVWNNQAGELWRRTTITMLRAIRRTAKQRGLDPATVRLGFGKVAEMQRRGVVHFHAIIRLDGADPDNPDRDPAPARRVDPGRPDRRRRTRGRARSCSPPPRTRSCPPAGSSPGAASSTSAPSTSAPTARSPTAWSPATWPSTPPKPPKPPATPRARLTRETIDIYANPHGSHAERLVHACWRLGGYIPGLRLSEQDERPHGGLRRWAHMLGFGGHFLTKSRLLLGHVPAPARRPRPVAAHPHRRPRGRPALRAADRAGRQLPPIRRRRLAHRRRRPARQHRRRDGQRATAGGSGRAHHGRGQVTAQPSNQPCTQSLLDNSTEEH